MIKTHTCPDQLTPNKCTYKDDARPEILGLDAFLLRCRETKWWPLGYNNARDDQVYRMTRRCNFVRVCVHMIRFFHMDARSDHMHVIHVDRVAQYLLLVFETFSDSPLYWCSAEHKLLRSKYTELNWNNTLNAAQAKLAAATTALKKTQMSLERAVQERNAYLGSAYVDELATAERDVVALNQTAKEQLADWNNATTAKKSVQKAEKERIAAATRDAADLLFVCKNVKLYSFIYTKDTSSWSKVAYAVGKTKCTEYVVSCIRRPKKKSKQDVQYAAVATSITVPMKDAPCSKYVPLLSCSKLEESLAAVHGWSSDWRSFGLDPNIHLNATRPYVTQSEAGCSSTEAGRTFSRVMYLASFVEHPVLCYIRRSLHHATRGFIQYSLDHLFRVNSFAGHACDGLCAFSPAPVDSVELRRHIKLLFIAACFVTACDAMRLHAEAGHVDPFSDDVLLDPLTMRHVYWQFVAQESTITDDVYKEHAQLLGVDVRKEGWLENAKVAVQRARDSFAPMILSNDEYDRIVPTRTCWWTANEYHCYAFQNSNVPIVSIQVTTPIFFAEAARYDKHADDMHKENQIAIAAAVSDIDLCKGDVSQLNVPTQSARISKIALAWFELKLKRERSALTKDIDAEMHDRNQDHLTATTTTAREDANTTGDNADDDDDMFDPHAPT